MLPSMLNNFPSTAIAIPNNSLLPICPDIATPPILDHTIEHITQRIASLRLSEQSEVNLLISEQSGNVSFKKFSKLKTKDAISYNKAYQATLLGQKVLFQSSVSIDSAISILFQQTDAITHAIHEDIRLTFDSAIDVSINIVRLITVNIEQTHLLLDKYKEEHTDKDHLILLIKVSVATIRTLLQLYRYKLITTENDKEYANIFEKTYTAVSSLQRDIPEVLFPTLTKYSIKDEFVSQPLVKFVPPFLKKNGKEDEIGEKYIDLFTNILEPHYFHRIGFEYIPELYFNRAIHTIKGSLPSYTDLPEKLYPYLYMNSGVLLATINHLSDELKASIFKSFQSIQRLKIGNIKIPHYITNTLSCLQSLKKIDFSHSKVSDKDLLSAFENRSITNINLAHCKITGRGLEGLLFKHVTQLGLNDCSDIKDPFIKLCSSMRLEEISLCRTSVSGSFLQGKAFLTLSKLNIAKCKHLKDGHLELCSGKLTHADFSNTNITGACLKAKAFESILELNLKGCQKLTDISISNCSSTSLKIINLSYTHISGVCLKEKVFVNVSSLFLSGCKNITDTAIVNCASQKLNNVNLSYTPITGKSFFSQTFKHVTKLVLKKCQNLLPENKEYIKNCGKFEIIDL